MVVVVQQYVYTRMIECFRLSASLGKERIDEVLT